LRRHIITNHSNLQTKTMVYFQRLLQANSRQRKLLQKAMTVSERAQLASYEVAEINLNQVSCPCGISDSSSVAIGNPEWHVGKASHHGSKQQ